jgi:hypothetical protein
MAMVQAVQGYIYITPGCIHYTECTQANWGPWCDQPAEPTKNPRAACHPRVQAHLISPSLVPPPSPTPRSNRPHQAAIRQRPWTPHLNAHPGSRPPARAPPGERRRGGHHLPVLSRCGGCFSDERRRAGGDLSPVDAASGAGRPGSRLCASWRDAV